MNKYFICFLAIFISPTFAVIPNITFEYAAPFDALVCPQIANSQTVTSEMMDEILGKMESLQQSWDKDNSLFWGEINQLLEPKNYLGSLIAYSSPTGRPFRS